ncbi:flagellar type III secretion system protein FlhB [Cereibacter sp. SYSU M97828]|nr:flagellar type III secretion system protein FlhB [Cereibacter flavus]
MSEDAEKEHEASQKKLDDAREKGEIARSPDLTAAAAWGGLVLAAAVMGERSLRGAGEAAQVLLDQADRLAPMMANGGAAPLGGVLLRFGGALLPFFAFPAAAALIALIVQRGFLITPSKLMPQLSRISPISGAKNKFGRSGLFEFGKSFAKLLLISVILGWFLTGRAQEIVATLYLDPALAFALALRMLLRFLMIVLLILSVLGGLDYLWQRFEHMRRNRMSRQEMLDEHKSSEGDPHTKAQRRQRGMEIATNRMLADVPKADVVVVNPTHYAVALKWDRAGGRAPVCVAKGVDEIAARIREKAAEAGVPIHRDPPTARALHATLEIGDTIHPDHYRAVAAAIRFAETMRKKAKERG